MPGLSGSFPGRVPVKARREMRLAAIVADHRTAAINGIVAVTKVRRSLRITIAVTAVRSRARSTAREETAAVTAVAIATAEARVAVARGDGEAPGVATHKLRHKIKTSISPRPKKKRTNPRARNKRATVSDAHAVNLEITAKTIIGSKLVAPTARIAHSRLMRVYRKRQAPSQSSHRQRRTRARGPRARMPNWS